MVATVPESMEATQDTVSMSWVEWVIRAAVPMAPNSSKVRVWTFWKMSRRRSAQKSATTWELVLAPSSTAPRPTRATRSIAAQHRTI